MIMTLGRGASSLCLLATMTLLAGCGEESPATSFAQTPHVTSPEPLSSAAPTTPASPPLLRPEQPQAPVAVSEPRAVLQGLSDEDAAEVPVLPAVFMSVQHDAMCHLKVGAKMPPLKLQTMTQEAAVLQPVPGKRLTVVVFWNLHHPMSVEQVCRLEREVGARFGEAGVGVVAVNVGDSTDSVQGLLDLIPHDYETLLDPDGSAFGQIATAMLPRSYLLDQDGTVLWLDTEYSRSSRRGLGNAAIYHLRQHIEKREHESNPLM